MQKAAVQKEDALFCCLNSLSKEEDGGESQYGWRAKSSCAPVLPCITGAMMQKVSAGAKVVNPPLDSLNPLKNAL